MRRVLPAVAATALLAGAVPALAASSDSQVEVGQTSTPVAAPTCPNNQANANCTIVLFQMTALETSNDSQKSPMRITEPGVISRFTVGISGITADKAQRASIVKSENASYGGPPAVQLTVLRPLRSAGDVIRYQVAAESPVQAIQPYFGTVTQFPLVQSLPVVPGEMVALTSPTWAPVLSINLSASAFGYVQSRQSNCTNSSKLPPYANPQTQVGESSPYSCSYTGTRVEYSATEFTTPSAQAAFRMAARRNRVQHPRVLDRAAA